MRLEVFGATRRIRGLVPRLRDTASRLGEMLQQEDSSACLLLTDDDGIRELNRRFRDRDEPTDVLSFPSGDSDSCDSPRALGDIAISLDRAAEQAAELGHSTTAEVEVLLLHGVLHLLGYDHERDRGQMRSLETRLARRLFGDVRGLVARAAAPPRRRTSRRDGARPPVR